jgi:hypothetical protein
MSDRDGILRRLTRRHVLVSAARWTALAAVGAVALRLVGRRGDKAVSASAAASRCARCGVFGGCRLPEAELQRYRGLGLVTPVRRARQGQTPAVEALCEAGRRDSGGGPDDRAVN